MSRERSPIYLAVIALTVVIGVELNALVVGGSALLALVAFLLTLVALILVVSHDILHHSR